MFKIKNNLLLSNIFLFILLELLFIINNYQVMAMDNNDISENNSIVDNNNEYNTFRNLLLNQGRIS
ncbi:SVM family protein [Candidatus Phytoplasma ziziphi]|uniref:SVM family protein n=1 Tax=Candidatus Phytoplasma TaxID=33926 RepID=UPI001F33E8F8|nr:SVM family protein [Candidatus Phytoplasma ziziphi]